jgi:hypothetical protein
MTKIRTLGFYQPFGTLMLHGKIETRWVREGRKPPFPLGQYLFYTTRNACDKSTLFNWCGTEIVQSITKTIADDKTRVLDGYAIGIGELVKIRHLHESQEDKAFVKFVGAKTFSAKEEDVIKHQWGLHFRNVKRIEPFRWKFGKQGIGYVPESELSKIKTIP